MKESCSKIRYEKDRVNRNNENKEIIIEQYQCYSKGKIINIRKPEITPYFNTFIFQEVFHRINVTVTATFTDHCMNHMYYNKELLIL